MDGMEAVIDQPVVDESTQDVAVDEQSTAVDTQDIDKSTDVDTEQVDTAKADGRTLPKDVQSALKALKEAHPEHAKALEELRKGYFSSRQHSEFFKSPSEAREAKTLLDLAGGAEGISNLQSQVAAIDLVDGALEAGDPQVLDDMFADFGEGMKKLASPFLERLEKLDPQVFGQTIQPHAYRMLEGAQLGERIAEAYNAIAENPDAAKTVLQNIYKWLETQKQQAGQKSAAPDPERAKFETQKKEFEQQREKTFREDIGRQTVAHQSDQINRSLTPYLKSKNLSPEAKTDLVEGINGEINRLLKADGTYQSQVKALLAARTRDPQNITRYINSRVAEAAPKAVKAVWERRYGTLGPAVRKPAVNGNGKPAVNPAQSGPIKLTAKPNRADVDWAKTKDILFITNKAYMKNGPHKGKMVTW